MILVYKNYSIVLVFYCKGGILGGFDSKSFRIDKRDLWGIDINEVHCNMISTVKNNAWEKVAE